MKLSSIQLIFRIEWCLNQTVQYFYKTVQYILITEHFIQYQILYTLATHQKCSIHVERQQNSDWD